MQIKFEISKNPITLVLKISLNVTTISNVYFRTVSNYLQEQDRRQYSDPKVWSVKAVLQSVKFPKIVKPVKKAHFQSQWTVKFFSKCIEFNLTIEIRYMGSSVLDHFTTCLEKTLKKKCWNYTTMKTMLYIPMNCRVLELDVFFNGLTSQTKKNIWR